MRTYKIAKNPIYNSMVHLDLYRVESSQDLKSIELEEIIADPQNLVVIEWAEKAEGTLPANRLDIKFKIKAKRGRKIQVSKTPRIVKREQ